MKTSAFIAALAVFSPRLALGAPSGPSDVVQLDPFEVQSGADHGYSALNSNSITRFNTELDRLPISADILDHEFMDDVAATTVEALVENYSAGAGVTSQDPTNAAGNNQPGDRGSLGSFTLRGLATPTVPPSERDGFMPAFTTATGYTSNFNVDRVEIINGPQALLYGNGGAGGVANIVSKQARFGAPAFGGVTYQIDQFGSKLATYDYGVGTANVAVRFAAMNQEQDGRRLNIGLKNEGYYGQIAVRLFGNTTIRINAEQSTSYRLAPANNLTLTSATSGSPYTPFNGLTLRYLLATGQQGALQGLAVNWNNVDSFEGQWNWETRVNELEEITAETRWNSWLSTQVAAGYNNLNDNVANSITWTLYPPDFTSKNPLPGFWTMQMSGTEGGELAEPSRTKAARASALATNDLFNGRAHSQTIVGVDFNRTDGANVLSRYFEADSNFNEIVSSAVTTNNGRTTMPVEFWPVGQGPVLYALGARPGAPKITVKGINLVLDQANPVSSALVTPTNPEGVTTPGNPTYSQSKLINRGVYGVNYTQWADGLLDTMAGFRYEGAYEITQSQGNRAPAPQDATNAVLAHNLSFDLGADIRLNRWLRPYASFSDSYQPPYLAFDPDGLPLQTARGLGEEAGIKLADPAGTVSGSLALYHVSSTNEEYSVSATLLNDINPSGLNGRFKAPSSFINVDRESKGAQAVLTAAPTGDWRLRVSAAYVKGTIKTGTSYAQLYNDQFNQNGQGQVTYADGTVVYVPPTFNSKTLTVASTTAGAIPLTIAMLGSPGSPYYAQPQPVNGQILSTSNGGSVLLNGATAPAGIATHGPILTGAVGLPISQQQINPGLGGVSIPGTIVTSVAGESTVGYPQLSANLTAVYTVPAGWLRGFRIGGTVSDGWRYNSYYYYPSGVFPGAPRQAFAQPSLSRFDLIAGYRRKLRRVTFSTQLNVNNLFNHYSVVLLPNVATGWTTPVGVNATFDQPPRTYVWTNSIAF